MNDDLTPTERLALKIQDLQAQLALKDEELFFAKSANARMRALLAMKDIHDDQTHSNAMRDAFGDHGQG